MNIIFIEDPKNPITTKIPISQRCEDPEFIKSNRLVPDVLYYLNNQLRNPICQFFSILTDTPLENCLILTENCKRKDLDKKYHRFL